MSNDEDRVGSGLFGCVPPDLTPLLDLLRSDRPIPPGVRDILAEMIDPKSSGYLHLRFELEDVEGKVRNQGRDNQNLEIAVHHGRLVREGMSSNQAAIDTGEKFGLDARRVYSRLAEWRQTAAWIKGKRATDEN